MLAVGSREQWDRLRGLREVFDWSFKDMSDVSGIAISTIHDRAKRENWKKPDRPTRRSKRVGVSDKGGAGDGAARDSGASIGVPPASGETAPADAASPSGPADAPSTAAIDALLAVPADARVTDILGGLIKSHMRAMFAEAPGGRFEKSQVDALWAMIRVAEWVDGQNRQEEEQAARDDELADLIERLNGRVVELARHFAGELAGGHDFAG